MLPPDYSVLLSLEGQSLRQVLCTANTHLTWQQVLTYGQQLASALAALHVAGYVHRDVKPDNVLMS